MSIQKFIEKPVSAKKARLTGKATTKILNPDWMEPLDTTAKKMIENGAERGQLQVVAKFKGNDIVYDLEHKDFASGGAAMDDLIFEYKKTI